jgi:phosphate butyryltransferase
MIRKLKDIYEKNNKNATKIIAIANACEDDVDLANEAINLGLAHFIFIGDCSAINRKVKDLGLPEKTYRVVQAINEKEAAHKMMLMIHKGEADIPMKGLIQTGTFMKAILDNEIGIKNNRLISQITIFEGLNDTLQFITDCAVNIEPDLNDKIDIIRNSVEIAQKLGYEMPKVALLGSVETVNSKMKDTIDGAVITQMNRRRQITGCIVDGPLALDNAISSEAAKKKKIDSEVAGNADVLVAPNLMVANTLSKAITYYAGLESASVIAGTRSPIVMTSRTDKKQNKLNTIAIACYLHSNI